jgi:hypothetical protein
MRKVELNAHLSVWSGEGGLAKLVQIKLQHRWFSIKVTTEKVTQGCTRDCPASAIAFKDVALCSCAFGWREHGFTALNNCWRRFKIDAPDMYFIEGK